MSTQRIDNALEKVRRGNQNLYTEEGQRLYSDEEHERRYEALLAEFDREKDSVVAEADRTIEQAERTLALEHRDLADSLTTEELERANAKRVYVDDDVWNLPLEALVKRVEAAQAVGDKPTMFLYARTLGSRASMEYEGGNVTEHTAGAVRDLETLAPELVQVVRGPEVERDLDRAREARRDANSLKIYTTEVRNKADGTEDRFRQEARQRIRQMF
jgi:hypothetical protein